MTLKSSQSVPQGLSMDLHSLDRLKSSAAGQPQGQVREVAKQLEGLFMQELVKSMRATTMDSGMLDNQATEMGTSMLDSQLASQLTGLPGGLSDVIARQLERQLGGSPQPASPLQGLGDLRVGDLPDSAALASTGAAPTATAASPTPSRAATRAAAAVSRADSQADRQLNPSQRFVAKHQAAAQAAERATGIPASNILGQAALESGWGKHEIRMKDGSPSHNLFGIKATSDWKGKVAEVTTTEYVGGVPHRVTAKFRAYSSYEEGFQDHARLLSKSPRYSQTVAQADTASGYAKGLQKAGYATDPEYANKLTRVINTTLRLQRSVA
ncbi:MAG: glucosaminidase [Pseudomonadota bacterium]|jgi:flagellar protein FlgJ